MILRSLGHFFIKNKNSHKKTLLYKKPVYTVFTYSNFHYLLKVGLCSLI